MQIDCTQCGARVRAEDVNLDRLLAKCRACDAVFEFGDRLAPGPAPAESRALARRRAPVPKPERIMVREEGGAGTLEPGAYRDAPARGGALVIERRWYSPIYLFMAFFCVFWDGFLAFWYSIALGSNGPIVWLPVLFPILHVAAGVGLTYSTIAGFFNRTVLRVSDAGLEVRHGPLPWYGNRRIAADDLTQLFCEEVVGSKGSKNYYLSALRGDGSKLRLLTVPSPDQALFIEQRVEERLGIADAEVGGEYRG
jgi:hypothetical protein